ncbi:MAG: hypothetical protein P1U68_02620 [Verrucomicrobiales bacterium]|nr:hypothetical protein [Verrucomicrobiales bacterium]
MPELAEVEYSRKQWNPGIGEIVREVRTHPKSRIYREIPAVAVEKGLTNRALVASYAHGKQMMFEFSGGAWLGLHLGMTGKLFVAELDRKEEKRDHLILRMKEQQLIFSDYRMFGKLTLELRDDGSPPPWWQELPPQTTGPDFTKKRHAAFVKRFPKTPLKTLLLDQRGYPGIGNWMADEICWRISIPPHTRSGELTDAQIDSVWKATRQISRDALKHVGDNWGVLPKSWLMTHRWKDGGICPRKHCKAELIRADLRGRTTCWCPSCQR